MAISNGCSQLEDAIVQLVVGFIFGRCVHASEHVLKDWSGVFGYQPNGTGTLPKKTRAGVAKKESL